MQVALRGRKNGRGSRKKRAGVDLLQNSPRNDLGFVKITYTVAASVPDAEWEARTTETNDNGTEGHNKGMYNPE